MYVSPFLPTPSPFHRFPQIPLTEVTSLIPSFPVSLNPDILNLLITYTPTYPDELPEISIEVSSGDLSDEEETFLLDGLRESAEESLGMVRSFSLSPPFPVLADELERVGDGVHLESEAERVDWRNVCIEERANSKRRSTTL